MEDLKDEIIKLQALQIKNLLRKLELSLPYEEFKEVSNDENSARYKELYEIIISSHSYKVAKTLSSVLDKIRIKRFLLRLSYLFGAKKS